MKLDTPNMLAEKSDGIGWMIFNNPERRNALSVAMRHAILQIMEDFAADDSVRSVVMTGTGDKAFVSGADISEFEKLRSSPEQIAEYHALSARVETALTSLDKPLIAMIRGFCLGGGLGTALNADMRFAAEGSQFGVPAARLSIGYPFSGIKKLVDLVGPAMAKEVLYTARRLSAEEALRTGLINQLVPADELKQTVTEIGMMIAENAPLSIRNAKINVENILKDRVNRDMEACKAATDACMASEDYVEGRRAFMEKRKPVFRGK
jgi:enoyl-CoA hydratase/carnithine racemase